MAIIYVSLGIRIPWSEEELELLPNVFKNSFDARELPDFESIRKAKLRYSSLARRSEAQIKSRIWNLLFKSKKY